MPIFSLKLSMKIKPNKVTIGNYFGKYPALTCATNGDKVFIHTPHKISEANRPQSTLTSAGGDVNLLNINQKVSSICAGNLNPSLGYDVLMIGTDTNLVAYDVIQNRDLFYRETPDGANAITIGKLGAFQDPLAIIGGNCSIQGFDAKGDDQFWTVTGDNVCSLALVDFDKDGQKELVVGSEDFDIRVFREDEIIAEMTETEMITCLHPISECKFGYALQNGTIGIYERTSRSWRIKSKNHAVSIFSFDLNNDGVSELITGWSNGKIDVRNDSTGEIIFKDNFNSSVAGIVKGAYTQPENDQLICCSVEGEVRGYNPLAPSSGQTLMDINVEQEMIREMTQTKQTLLMELKNYQDKLSQSQRPGGTEELEKSASMIPVDTKVNCELDVNTGNQEFPGHVVLTISTNNDTIIRAVTAFAEGIFDGESHVIHPHINKVSSSLKMPLRLQKDIPVDAHLKVLVGYKNCSHFHVFEINCLVPRFAMYIFCQQLTVPEPEGFVKFTINDRIQRVCIWINQNFLLKEPVQASNNLHLSFLSMHNQTPLVLTMDPARQVIIKTDDLDVAGNIVQSLATYLKIDDLNVTAHFPEELKALNVLIEKVDGLNSMRQTLTANIADHSNLIRSMVVRAEDTRLIGDMKTMKRGYIELYNLNRDLVRDYNIRCNNHTELVSYLKQVNLVIQKASRLRVGKYKTQVVTLCRAAIKNNNISALVKIITTGAS